MKYIESIFWGIIAAAGAILVQLFAFLIITILNPTAQVTLNLYLTMPLFIIISAFIEELFKFIVISQRIKLYSKGKLNIINALLVGLGFFGLEFAIISNNYSTVGVSFAYVFEIAILHIGTAGLIGYMIEKNKSKNLAKFSATLVIVTIFHFVYNILSSTRSEMTNYGIYVTLASLILLNFASLLWSQKELAKD